MPQTVLLTDYAWPDDAIERKVIEAAGHRLVAGPSDPAPAEAIVGLAAAYNPGAILTCWAQVNAAAIASAPNLRIVARLGVGLDNIDVAAATARGIWVTNVPDYCIPEVSDQAVGFALAWARGIVQFDREVRAGHWNPAGARLRRLAGMTCGIIGFGRIGRATAAKMAALGCRIVAHDPHARDGGTVPLLGLDELLACAEIIVLHAPLTAQTRHMIGRAALAKMRDGAFLINVSRGGLVDTAAVVAALDAGKLSGVGFDVLDSEPEVPPALLGHRSALITPHVAFASDASVAELRRRAAEEVVRVLAGEAPQRPCNEVPA